MELANFGHREQRQKTCSLRGVIAGVMAARRFQFKARISRKGGSPDYVRIDIDCTLQTEQEQQSDQTSDKDAELHKKLQDLVIHGSLDKLSELGGAVGIARQLKSSLQNGISPSGPIPTSSSNQASLLEAELEKGRARFGKNTLLKKRGKTFWHILWDSCRSNVGFLVLTILGILLVGLGLKIKGPEQGWYSGASLILFQFVDEVVNALAKYWLSRESEKLSDREEENIRAYVLRCGRKRSVPRAELVVGDLVELRSGNQVPADGLLVQGDSFIIRERSDFHTDTTSNRTRDEDQHAFDVLPSTDTSCLFGRGAAHPFLSCGCTVEAGHGLMLVIAVGKDTMWANKRANMSAKYVQEEITPLQKRLSNYSALLRILGLSVAMLYVILFLPFYFSGHYKIHSLDPAYFKAGKTSASDAIYITILALLSNGLTLFIAVPTGLPLAVQLTLAYSMPRMLADKAQVRKLAICETLGCVTTICTDIRTLTPMDIGKIWTIGELFEADSVLDFSHWEHVSSLVFEGVAQNSTDDLTQGADLRRSRMEKAPLEWCLKAGMQSAEVERAKSCVLKMETSSFEKQQAGVAVFHKNDGRLRIHWKGAAEVILSSCSNWMDASGEPRAMTDTKRQELTKLIKNMGDANLHSVAFAYCEVDPAASLVVDSCWPDDKTLPDRDLTLLALMGVKDCGPGLIEAVEMVKKAGVKVRIVTGENPVTAKAIAEEYGILVEDSMQEQVVEGPTFRNWGLSEMRKKLPQLTVLARASPQDKQLLVDALQTYQGEVVAFIGDKANEAPALREAHVGMSMGGGVQAAKISSGIVMLDNSFTSIAKVLEWGRGIRTTIQSFLQFQFTISITATVVSLAGMGALWVELIVSNLCVLALAMEPPSRTLMLRRPTPCEEPLITNAMLFNVALQAAYQVIVLGSIGQFSDASLNRTIIFNTFVFCQIFNAVNARRSHRKNIFEGILRSPLFIGIMATIIILQVFMVEFMGKFVSTSVSLRWDLWLYCLGFAAASWLIAFFGKFLPIPPTLVPSSS